MKTIDCYELNVKSLQKIYEFVNNKNCISNKEIEDSNSILWNILFLRKIINKSINYTRRSSKYTSKFEYVILDRIQDSTPDSVHTQDDNQDDNQDNNQDDNFEKTIIDNIEKIKCFFSFVLISKSNYPVYELSVILLDGLPPAEENTILENIKNAFLNISALSKNALFTLYADTKFTRSVNSWFSVNSSSDNLVYATLDKYTYIKPYNIYFYNNTLALKTGKVGKPSKSIINEYVNIIEDVYFIDRSSKDIDVFKRSKFTLKQTQTQIQRTIKQTMNKTKKQIQESNMNVCNMNMKNIWDVSEIIDRPEYDFDFAYINLFSVFFVYINKYYNYDPILVINLLLMKKPKKYNDKLAKNYIKIYKYLKYFKNVKNIKNIKNINSEIINFEFLFNTNELSRLNTYIRTNIFFKNIKSNYKINKLCITNSDDDIKILKDYNINIIYLKQHLDLNLIIPEIKQINPNILIGTDFSKYNDCITHFNKLNKIFDYIYINTLYLNYDYILSSINLLIKLPFFIHTVCNALTLLNKNGDMDIYLYYTNINIPSIKKIMYILVNLFHDYNFNIIYITNIICISFKNFKGLDTQYQNIINSLIKEVEKFENSEFTIDDVANCMISNKFYYKLDNPDNNYYKNIHKQVIYDFNIPLLEKIIKDNNKNNNNVKQFYSKYNKYNTILYNYNKNNYLDYKKLGAIEFKNKLIKNLINIINHYIILILYYLDHYNIIEINNIDKIVKNKVGNNINNYMNNIRFIK